MMDLWPLEYLLVHPGCISIALVLVARVDPPLARLYSSAEEAPHHSWSIQMRPLDQIHVDTSNTT